MRKFLPGTTKVTKVNLRLHITTYLLVTTCLRFLYPDLV
jgi:hypothetical protein